MGGEVGDTGVIVKDGRESAVLDTKAPEKGLSCHVVKAEADLAAGDELIARVDAKRRAAIERNHTATHILHATLRQVLGEHVKQAGSLVEPERLRFDFTHFEALSPAQIAEVERVANDYIMGAVATTIYETSLDEARAAGVTALFGEKYGDAVRVVQAGEFSRELCGGCHVANTAEIGFVKIISESSVGANLRRIEAVTSHGALEYLNRFEAELKRAAAELRTQPLEVADRAAANLRALKEAQKAAKKGGPVAGGGLDALLATAATAKGGYPVVISRTDVTDAGELRNLWDVVSSRLSAPGAMVVAADRDGKPILMAAGTEEAVAAGFNAGAVIKAIAPCVKGGGGGKPTMAQAGGKDSTGIDDALAAARDLLL